MRILVVVLVAFFFVLAACAPGTGQVLPTGVPPELATGVARAPTVSSNAATIVASAVQAVETQAVNAGTLVAPAATAAAEALQEAQSQAQNAGTLVPPASTLAANGLREAQTEAARGVATAAPLIQTTVPPSQPTATPPPGRTIDVKITENKIDMPATMSAGVVVFRVTNAGATIHNLQVVGPGIEKKLDADLNPGETKTLQVTLSQGTYSIYCPVGNHKALGEQLTLTVTP